VYVRLLGYRIALRPPLTKELKQAIWFRASPEEGCVRGQGFGDVGQLAALRGVPGELLRDFVASWGLECSELGLDLAHVDDDDLGVQLWNLLQLGRTELPPGLVDALDRIDDLANEPGFDAILSRVEGTGFEVDWEARGLSPVHLALRTWVHYRRLFEEAEIKRTIARAGAMVEFPACGDADAEAPSGETASRLQERLAGWWRERGRGDFCRVEVFEEPGMIYVPIHHGRTWRTEPTVEGTEESAVAFRPRAADLAAWDVRTGRLRVKAPDRRARVEYRRQLSEALFGDADRLVERQVVGLSPIAELGRASLAPTPGLREVVLTELRMRHRRGRRSETILRGDDVMADLEERHDVPDPGECDLIFARLLLRFSSGGQRRKVELKTPNEVAFDRRKDGHVVLRFLEERGFLAAPAEGPPEPPPARTGQLGLWG